MACPITISGLDHLDLGFGALNGGCQAGFTLKEQPTKHPNPKDSKGH